jgi:hypothetical protein
MGVSGPSRVNGTYHVAVAQKERVRRTRLLILLGTVLSLVGMLNVVLINNDMTRIEESGPQHLALAGGGIAHFVPSILAGFQRAQQSPSTVTAIDPLDPRHSVPFIEDKRALERWTAFTGLSLAMLFVGLESRIPTSTVHPRSPTGTDLSRLLLLLSVTYGALSFFENG